MNQNKKASEVAAGSGENQDPEAIMDNLKHFLYFNVKTPGNSVISCLTEHFAGSLSRTVLMIHHRFGRHTFCDNSTFINSTSDFYYYHRCQSRFELSSLN